MSVETDRAVLLAFLQGKGWVTSIEIAEWCRQRGITFGQGLPDLRWLQKHGYLEKRKSQTHRVLQGNVAASEYRIKEAA